MLNNKPRIMAAVLGALSIIPGASAIAAPFTYAVEVKTNFGTKFADCFTFQGDGTLVVSGLGNLVYTPAPTNPSKYYTAVTTVATANSINNIIAFSGFKTGTKASGTLHAVGSDIFRDSYSIRGTAVASCTTSAANGMNWLPPAK